MARGLAAVVCLASALARAEPASGPVRPALPSDPEEPAEPPVPWPEGVLAEYVAPCAAPGPPAGRATASDWSGAPLRPTADEARELSLPQTSTVPGGCLTAAGACAGASLFGLGGVLGGACLGGFNPTLSPITGAAGGIAGAIGGLVAGAELGRRAAPPALDRSVPQLDRQAFHQLRRRRLAGLPHRPLHVHPALGWEIDARERDRFGLFPDLDDAAFARATFWYKGRALLFLESWNAPTVRVFAAPLQCIEEVFDAAERKPAPPARPSPTRS